MVNLQKGLVGHWTMDSRDTDNGIIRDKSGYNNHGVINGITSGHSGKVGEKFKFDGTDDVMSTGDVIDYTGGNEFSVSLWIKPNEKSFSIPIAKRNTGAGYEFQIPNQNNVIDGYISDGSSRRGFNEGSTKIKSGVYIHCVYTFTPSDVTMYYNKMVESVTDLSSFGDCSNSLNFYIGGREDRNDSYFNGSIDDVRVYNRALSEKEINALYQMRSARVSQNTPSNITLNGKNVVLEQDSFGSWILVLNYEHYGGTNPIVSPSNQFPQLPDGKKSIKEIETDGSNGELQHVDNISQYGDFQVDAVRLEGMTSNHDRKIHYFTDNDTVIQSIVSDSTKVSYKDMKSNVRKYPDHTANLPDAARNDTGENSEDHIFGPDFPMYKGGTYHWSIAGFGNRWEVDDYPDGAENTTIHRVWVRTQLY